MKAVQDHIHYNSLFSAATGTQFVPTLLQWVSRQIKMASQIISTI